MFPNGEDGVLEIGYWVFSPAAGRGLATRAAAALTEEGLRLPGVKAMEIHCDQANVRSAGIRPRSGYRLLRCSRCDGEGGCVLRVAKCLGGGA